MTHALASVALGRAGLNKVTSAATPMLLISGLVADIDWATRLGPADLFLRGHRTVTHSLVGTAAIAVLVACAARLAGNKFPKLAVGFLPAISVCAIGAGAHLLLDLLNPDGVQLLWPFSARRYAWDLADSVDVWILFFLFGGLFIPELFRLVHEEIGSKSNRDGRQRGAVVALVLVALFIGGRAFAHQRAIALLDSRNYRDQTPLTVAAFPRPSNPLVWSGIVETDSAIINLQVPLGPGSEFDPEQADVHFKPAPSPALNNAISSAAAKEFLNFARFPLATVEPEEEGFQIRVRDMRFASEPAGRRGIIAVFDLNAQNSVIRKHVEYDDSTRR